jgi:hypothetical protein
MAACDLCDNTRWLGGLEGNGPCVCCTPSAMVELEQMLADAEHECDQLQKRVKALEDEADTTELAHTEALDKEAAPYIGALADARTHLENYLVRLGLPANPVTLDDPDLWGLLQLLT